MWPGLRDPEDEVTIGELRPPAWHVAAWMAGFLPLQSADRAESAFTDGPALIFMHEFQLLVLIVRVTTMLKSPPKTRLRVIRSPLSG